MINTSIDIRNDVTLEQIYEYIDTGDVQNAPEDVVRYLQAMEKVYSMSQRIDKWGSKDAIIKHLIKVNGLSYYRANKLYNATMEYFYADLDVSRAALRNAAAEKVEKLENIGIEMIKDVRDVKSVVDIIHTRYKMLQLDKDDPIELPEEMFDKPFKLYTTNAEALGMIPANRNELAAIIDELDDISEVERDILRREAGILPKQVIQDIDAREIKK